NFTAGRYEIVSVSGNAATLDRACGTTNNASGGTWYEGGAFANGETVISTTLVAGNTLWIKAGSYTAPTTNWNIGAWTGTATLSIAITGYNTTRGDSPTGNN